MDKWDARFMELAGVIANWASCYKPNRKIGAVIVRNKRIVEALPGEMERYGIDSLSELGNTDLSGS